MTGKLVPESLIPVIDVVGFMHRVLLLFTCIILGHEGHSMSNQQMVSTDPLRFFLNLAHL